MIFIVIDRIMKKLLTASVLGLGLVGCASSNYENFNKPPIVPVNEAFNSVKMPEHGFITDQDVHNMPEHVNINYSYKVDF